MTKQRAVLVGIIIVLAVLPFVVRHYLAGLQRMPVQERPDYVHIEDILPVHEQRIKDRIDMLRQKTLDETFEYLLEDQQYFYPGYVPGGIGPMDMQKLLSTLCFLKVVQEFDALPHEQAIEKLHEFCKQAITRFKTRMNSMRFEAELTYDDIMRRNEEFLASAPPGNHYLGPPKYMVCASLFLAARMGEYELLVRLIDEIQDVVRKNTERLNNDGAVAHAGIIQLMISASALEYDAILTILMYALRQAGKNENIPFEWGIKQQTIPICRWDAPLTHYDFGVLRGMKKPAHGDVIENFVVYEFPSELFFSDPGGQRKKMIDVLKERLSDKIDSIPNPI